ncbi:MAG: peptide deformylase [Vampirovibrionales bacterium]|nr:peptide deformylase [Vampirovibrionales bacterium]
MAIVKVYQYPHASLREPCHAVNALGGAVETVVRDLVDTMYAFGGAVGLSAPQIGSRLRVIAMDVAAKSTRDQLRVMINPVIEVSSRNKLVREGCLSFPEYLANVKRATRLTVRYLDADGAEVTHEARDLEAIAIQHEIDHLDGVLMIDRVNSLKTDLLRRYAGAPLPAAPSDVTAPVSLPPEFHPS